MKEEIKGKYSHTKIRVRTITSKDSPEEIKEAFNEPESPCRSFYESYILDATERAEGILKKAGLPTCPIYKQTVKGRRREGYLSTYVDALGYEHDSLEGLAARIISKIWELRTAEQRNLEQDKILFHAIEFGELTTNLKRNSAIARERSRNKSEGKRKPWANIAKRLIDDNPGAEFAACWRLFPHEEEGELYNCYVKDGELCYSKYGEEEDTKSKETFRTAYFYPEKKNRKK